MAAVFGNFKSKTTLAFNELLVCLRIRNSLKAKPEIQRISDSAHCRDFMLFSGAMRNRFEIGVYEPLLVGCAAALAALVYAEGWIWPLKAAAVIIPVSLLIG